MYIPTACRDWCAWLGYTAALSPSIGVSQVLGLSGSYVGGSGYGMALYDGYMGGQPILDPDGTDVDGSEGQGVSSAP